MWWRAILLAVAIAAAPGCAVVGYIHDHWNPVKPPQPVDTSYTVVEGQRELRQLNVGGGVSFFFTPARDGTAQNEDVALFACDEAGCDSWAGGNPAGTDSLSVRVNAYDRNTWKIKAYCPGGQGYAGEKKISAPWQSGATNTVEFSVLPGKLLLMVDGKPAEISCSAPQKFTVGVGWPPQKRSGALGAKLDGIVWSGTSP